LGDEGSQQYGGESGRVRAVKTSFLRLELALSSPPRQLRQDIEQALVAYGEPLRWAITEVKLPQQVVIVEAIVTNR
jgi:hypothetical protein